MNIIGTMELYTHSFKTGVALSTKVSCKDKESGEYQNRYISVYLSHDFKNRDKILESLNNIEKGYYLNIEVEEGELIAKTYKGDVDVCIIIKACKFSKPVKFEVKKGNSQTKQQTKSTKQKSKSTEEVESDDLPF